MLGADTLVALDGDILGKPADADQAREYVARLAGRTHEVVGGIALVRDGELDPDAAVEITQVRFRAGEPRAARLVRRTGEWQGRAGGYAIQGAAPRSSRASRATTSTSSACRSRACWTSCPELLRT